MLNWFDCKGKDQLWSCDCIVKETLWNRSEKVDHLAYKYLCVLAVRFCNHQNDKKFGPVFVKLQALYTERCIWDYTHTCATHMFISHIPIDKLIYQIYQLVGGFPANFYHHILVKTYSFTWLVLRASISLFEIGAFPILVFTFNMINY